MKQRKQHGTTTTVPWRLLGLLCLLSLIPALFYLTRLLRLPLLIQVSYLLSIGYPLLLAWLCMRGSGPFLVYLGLYLFLIAAILVLPTHSLSRLSRLRLVCDSLIILAAVTTLCYYFLLVKGEGSWQVKAVATAFPEADLVLFFACSWWRCVRGPQHYARCCSCLGERSWACL